MPYSIRKKNGSYVVVKKGTGRVVAGNKTKLSKQKAKKVMAAKYHAESGRPFTKS